MAKTFGKTEKKQTPKTNAKQKAKYTPKKNNKNQKTTNKKAAPKTAKRTYKKSSAPKNTKPIKIIPLGGLDEIGKNITLYAYGDDMFLVDCGMSFPPSLGVG